MKQIHFKVTFLSEVVLQASSNTQGKISVLDFIPGSNFLGMVARYYGEFENPFDVFHSGKVRFGDATLLEEDNITYKVPFSYFKPKEGGNVYNHHLITEFDPQIQLKQIRNGYITKDGKHVSLGYNYAQKSSYDTEKRRSKESGMFGYTAMKEGSEWGFCISYDEGIDIAQIISKVVGKKQLGKSKSAQYGSVEMQKTDKLEEDIEDIDTLKDVVLYAKSRWALYDEYGMPTFEPTPYNLGLHPDTQIKWDKCQIRTSTYTPYNGARKTKDYTRVVVEKGSVIVVDKVSKTEIAHLKHGVGAYLSEGFGEVLINPMFTKDLHPKYESSNISKSKDTSITKDENILAFLKAQKDKEEHIFALSKKVDDFITQHYLLFTHVSNAQWGQIRSICNQSDTTDENINEKVENFIQKGVAKKQWEKGKKVLLNTLNNVAFTQLLAMHMPKRRGDKND